MACTYATAARLIARVTTEPTSTDLERLRCTVCGLTAADYYAVRREEDPKTGRRDRVYLCERCYRGPGDAGGNSKCGLKGIQELRT